MVSVCIPCASIPGLVPSSPTWVIEKASGVLFPSFTLHTALMLSLPSSIFITLCPCSRSSRNLSIAYWMKSELNGLVCKTLLHKETSTMSLTSSLSLPSHPHWSPCFSHGTPLLTYLKSALTITSRALAPTFWNTEECFSSLSLTESLCYFPIFPCTGNLYLY